MNEKIGVLRSFVRKYRAKGDKSIKYVRSFRELQIIME